MPFEHLLSDLWASNPAALDEETFFLAEVAYGHLVHHFSTPASFMTWDEDTPRRIQELLHRVAATHPKVKPTSALRTMLVVLSIKKDIPNAVAFNEDIELLFMMAFKTLAAAYDRSFTDAVFQTITHSHYVDTKMDHYPHYLLGHIAKAVADDQRQKMDAKILDILKFYLTPFIPTELNGVTESPALPPYCELVRREPSRHKQSLAFPDPLHRMSPLSPVMEEELSGTDLIYSTERVEAEGAPEEALAGAERSPTPAKASFTSLETDTDLSSVSDPFDDMSQTSSMPSLPSSFTSVVSESTGQAGDFKYRDRALASSPNASLTASATQHTQSDVKVNETNAGSSAPSSSSSSLRSSSTSREAPSMHSIRHNPATQLNAVFFGDKDRSAKTLSTRCSHPVYVSDPFPDPYSMSPPNPHAYDSRSSRPETFVHTVDTFPVKQLRQWQANRRGRKAFAESASSKPRSKSKLMLKLNRARVVKRNFHEHDDSSRLLREGGDAAHGKWKRSSLQPWKRMVVLPVAYVRLRIREIRYGYE